ncbi:outer membrane beta-barrel protein [Arcicella aquatica]|uniref:Outer membrane beta-barrel protein n=1 Tax=Arcicella aquatica TaxID=217141 RepID=A0ABU5QUZ3_9BACT|nr:outer membrane beta-barrel protein [Arcicella aquatica]MEA5260166.1 outer membrane beta-barrel protein [Arcicella aquatica]
MKKHLLILLLLQSTLSFSQKFGARIGLSVSDRIISLPNIGFLYELPLTSKLSLSAELNRTLRGHIVDVLYMDAVGNSLAHGNEGIVNSFVELPVHLKIHLNKNSNQNIGFSLKAGPYISYSLKRSLFVKSGIMDSDWLRDKAKEFDGSTLGASKIDYGINLGLVYGLKKIPLNFELRYYQGFSKQEQHNLYFYDKFQPEYPFNQGTIDYILRPKLNSIWGFEWAIGYKF